MIYQLTCSLYNNMYKLKVANGKGSVTVNILGVKRQKKIFSCIIWRYVMKCMQLQISQMLQNLFNP